MGNLYHNTYRLSWLIAFLLLVSIKLSAQEKSVYGKALDFKTKIGISSVNIQNLNTKQIVATNEAGDFYIRAKVGDSLIISSMGYNRKGIRWDGKTKNPIIYTEQQAIMLRELLVEEKKLDGLNEEIKSFLDNPQNGRAVRNEILKRMINTNTSSAGSIGISIDALYDLYSKEGKANRKLADIQYLDAKNFYSNLKYNKSIVAQITHLEGEELDDFMKFCKPTQDYILRANDYDLTFKILKCMGDFRQTRIFRRLR